MDYKQLLNSTPEAALRPGIMYKSLLSSGNRTIDDLRLDIKQKPTIRKNYTYRRSVANIWLKLLGRLGMDIKPAVSGLGGKQYHTAEIPEALLPELIGKLDVSLQKLEELQQLYFQQNETDFPCKVNNNYDGKAVDSWPLHRFDMQNTGRTTDPGPQEGELAWKFPIGHSWYGSAYLENGRVYVPSPGTATTAYCLDEKTGKVIWTARQDAMTNRHFTPKICSSAVSCDGSILLRESGSWGNKARQQAIHILELDKNTGDVTKKYDANHVDYRTGFVGMSTNTKYLVYPYGTHEILSYPPVITPLNRLACRNMETGKRIWDIHCGPMYCDPVSDAENTWAVSADGTVMCLNFYDDPVVKWQYNIPRGIYTSPVLDNGYLFFGANNGSVYCLDKKSGELIWESKISKGEARAKMLFSSPRVSGAYIIIGAADCRLYCLDKQSGAFIDTQEMPDWIRSAPYIREDRVYAAAIDGTVSAFEFTAAGMQKIWQAKASEYEIFANLSGGESALCVSSSDLVLSALDFDTGRIIWRHSLLECVYLEDGSRILADGGSGGNHQSTPIVAENKVFIGGANRFVYAINRKEGTLAWKYETDGQVSAAPVYNDGKIYFGQQGGGREFCSLKASDGSPVWKQNTGWVWTSPNICEDKVVTTGCGGEITCMHTNTGQILWVKNIGGGSYPTPSIDNNTVFVGGWEGWYYAFDLASGNTKWKYYLSGRPDSGASMAHGGKVYIQGHGYVAEQLLPGEIVPPESGGLICLEQLTGAEIWKQAPSNVSLALDQEGKNIYGTVGQELCCLDTENGKTRWSRNPGGGVSGPSIAGNRLYSASSNSPFFTCFDIEGSKAEPLWQFKMDDCVGEPCPAIAGGMAFVLCLDGNVYAFK